MESKIRFNNIQLYGWHGVDDEEKHIGQRFEIDIEVIANLDIGIKTDNITKTLNYRELYEMIEYLFSEKIYNLIETLANKIALSILEQYDVMGCKVIIRKPNVNLHGILDSVIQHTSKVFKRCIAMPNLEQPITHWQMAAKYKNIIESNSQANKLQAFIPCYLTDNIEVNNLKKGINNKSFFQPS